MKKYTIKWDPLPQKSGAVLTKTSAPQTEAQKKTAGDNALIKRANADTPFDFRGNIQESARGMRVI